MKLNNLLLLIGLSVMTSSQALAETCSKAFLEELVNNKKDTSLYKKNYAKQVCVGKLFQISGVITDISEVNQFEMDAEDGMSYTVRLNDTSNCGNLITAKKGQKAQIEGTSTEVYINIHTLRIEKARCINPIR